MIDDNSTQSAPSSAAQDRVNKEMFRAIELLGHKLARAEDERDRLQRRLAIIESAATVDNDSGRLYLPVVVDAPVLPPPAVNPRWLVATSLASSAFAIVALGMVLLGPAKSQLSPQQLAALDTLALAQSPVTNVDAPALASAAPATVSPEPGAPAATPDQPKTATAAPAATSEAAPVSQSADAGTRTTLEDNIDISRFMPASKRIAALKPDEASAVPPGISTSGISTSGISTSGISASGVSTPGMSTPASADASLAENDTPTPQQLAAIEPAAGDARPATDISLPAFHADAAGGQSLAPAAGLSTMRLLNGTGAKINGEKMTWGMAIYSVNSDARLNEAATALQTRAFKGAAEAQHDLGVLYATGTGGAPLDKSKAEFWLKRAAGAHIPDAAYNLGVLSAQNDQLSAAREWYQKAAALGHPQALYNLGLLYMQGRGVAPDVARGIDYFKQAANAGEGAAAYNLGLLYEGKGPDVSTALAADPAKAIEWYRVAASAGETQAKAALTRLNVADIEPAAGTSIDANEGNDLDGKAHAAAAAPGAASQHD